MELEEDLREKYGFLGVDFRAGNVDDAEGQIELCGYPGDKDPHTMWSASKDFESLPQFLGYKIPTFRGQSGSPIIKRVEGREYVIGVHIGSNAKETKNIAIRLTPDKREVVHGWTMKTIGYLNLGKKILI